MFVFAFVLLAVAWAQPKLSDDFTANVMLDFTYKNRERHAEGQWYVDHTGMRDRLDAEIPFIGRVDHWQIWNSTKTGTEYALVAKDQKCEHRTYEEPLIGVFDFLKMAKADGTCYNGGTIWTYTSGGTTNSACVSHDGGRPRWVDRKGPVFTLQILFHTFNPGRPDASEFVIPAECK